MLGERVIIAIPEGREETGELERDGSRAVFWVKSKPQQRDGKTAVEIRLTPRTASELETVQFKTGR